VGGGWDRIAGRSGGAAVRREYRFAGGGAGYRDVMKTRRKQTARKAVSKRRKKPIENTPRQAAVCGEESNRVWAIRDAAAGLCARVHGRLQRDESCDRRGYSPKSARAIASENLTKPAIREAVAELIEEAGSRGRIMREVARMHFALTWLTSTHYTKADAEPATRDGG
jgi:hypothetical protein